MKILVTGGAGYIGSHVCMALKKVGHEPVVLDSLVKGHEWAVKYGPFVKADIGDAGAVRAACEAYKPEALIHFAAFIEVGESVENPEKYINNNFHKAKILFDTVRDCGIQNVVFSSTAAVYGTPITQGPIAEDHPLAPINPYGESKLLAENYLRDTGVNSVALRYFNAAGAAVEEGIGESHNPETHLVPNVLLAGLKVKDEVCIFGDDYPTRDGTAMRDYIHVLDLADAHLRALDYLVRGGATNVFNLGTGTGSTVLEVVRAAEKALGQPIPQNRHPRRAGDPPFLLADASKAKSVLGWSPKRTLDDIVTSALAWHSTR